METDKGFESYAAETFVSPTFNSLFSGLRAVNTARWFGGGGVESAGFDRHSSCAVGSGI